MKKNQSLYNLLKDRIKTETDNRVFIKSPNNRLIESEGTFSVINRFDIPPVEVKATNWFEDIWLYLKIDLRQDKEKGKKDIPFVSICFFQLVENSLNSLFRAEWDNNPLVEGYNHPQPHWHISHSNNDNEDFNTLKESSNKEEDLAGDFMELFDSNIQTLDMYKMHFAMAGSWINDGTMTTEYIDNEQIADWIIHLLQHVKKEIIYVKSRKN